MGGVVECVGGGEVKENEGEGGGNKKQQKEEIWRQKNCVKV